MKQLETLQSELGEKVPKIVLGKFYNLTLVKIPLAKNRKTPDYKIFNNTELIAISEVKSCVSIIGPADINLETSYEEIAEISKKRDKNHRSKLGKHHDKALSQLPNDQNLPTVIIFVSFDMTDYIDMGMMLQDHKETYPSASMADVYVLIKIHQGIIPSNNFEIKETIRVMYNTEAGRYFSEKYFPLIPALQNAGTLPLVFTAEA
ncbi:MAG: hypothetical protein Q7S28_00175 [bacterium]|nr:hypothetical protein [bacterium]